jgi:phosphate-selective porin OprO and OprP
MKRILFTAVAAMTMFGLCGTAQAKTLEEILREKGVITEEDYKEAIQKRDFAYYTPGRGITVQTRDGNFTANIGGRLQARYTFIDYDDSTKDDSSDFAIQRLRISMTGNVFTKNLYYAWQHDFGGTNGSVALKDAILGYKFHDAFSLQIGQFKAPTSRQQLTSSGRQMFVDRSLADETFNLGRDRGVMAKGALADGMFEYMAGVFNGNGENRGNFADDHMFAMRLDFNPLGKFSMDEPSFSEKKPLLNIGASFATQTMNQGENTNSRLTTRVANVGAIPVDTDLDWWTATANVHFKYQDLSLGGEFYFANVDPQVGTEYDAYGYYVQAGYMIIPSTLELAGRYSAIKSDDTGALRTFDKQEYQAAVSYYFKKHNAKLQADFTHVNDDLNANADDNIFRLQAQVLF